MTTPQVLTRELLDKVSGLTPALAQRWATTYGSRVWTLLGDSRSVEDLGAVLGADLHVREVEYLQRHEWVTSADDVLWRRTKLGLVFTDAERAALEDFLAHSGPAQAAKDSNAA